MRFNLELELERARNYRGALDEDVKERVRAVYRRPSNVTWEDAHSLILSMQGIITTLWDGVLAVKPSFPRSKPCNEPWPSVPDRKLLAAAISYLTHQGVASLDGLVPYPCVHDPGERYERTRYHLPDDYFIDRERYIPKPFKYGLCLSGAHPSGCALDIGYYTTLADALKGCEQHREGYFARRMASTKEEKAR